MAGILHTGDCQASVAANVTTFFGLGDFIGANATEAQVQVPWRAAGAFSGLGCSISANTTTATSTLAFRVGGVTGAQAVSIGSGLTGLFQDATNSDVVAAGNLVNLRLVAGATGTSLIIRQSFVVFSASTSTVCRFIAGVGAKSVLSDNGVTRFFGLQDGLTGNTTESAVQFKFRTAGTLAWLAIDITANARTTTTTLRSRIGGGNGGGSISITASTTGLLEDSSGTDTIASTNLVNYGLTFGASAENLTVAFISSQFTTTNNQSQIIGIGAVAISVNTSTTNFISLGSLGVTGTETLFQCLGTLPMTLDNAQINVATNGITATSTARLRKNAGNGNLAISIASSTTGIIEDTTNTDATLPADKLVWSLVTGGTGTSLTFNSMGCRITMLGGPFMNPLLDGLTVAGSREWYGDLA